MRLHPYSYTTESMYQSPSSAFHTREYHTKLLELVIFPRITFTVKSVRFSHNQSAEMLPSGCIVAIS